MPIPYRREDEIPMATRAAAASTPPLSDKVAAGTVTGAITVLLVWLVGLIFHIEVPDLVAGALPVILGAIGAWVRPDGTGYLQAALTARGHTGRHEA